MKFGTQILDKSVPQWRHNNIDYQKLKTVIKKATTKFPQDETNKINLIKCTNLFLEQFNSVNLFTSLKIKQISSKIVGIENLIIKYSQILQNPNIDVITPEESKRQIKAIRNATKKCNKEMRMLSRYLILQRIAVRKLFKKFIKYYPWGKQAAEEYIDTLRNSDELSKGYEGISFMTLNIDPYLLEISLIFDVLEDLDKKAVKNLDIIKSSLATVTSGNGRVYEDVNDYPTGSPIKEIPSTIEFDTLFWGKSHFINRFLLSNENTEEFKFVLLSSKFQIMDDEIISTSREIVDNSSNIRQLAEAKGAKSVRSFNELRNIASFSSLVGNSKTRATTVGNPSLTSNMYLSLLAPAEDISKDTRYIKEMLSNKSYNEHPSFLVHSNLGVKCILQSHVGGLRDHIITNTLPMQYILDTIESRKIENIEKLGPLNKLSMEWLQSKNLKPTNEQITFKRTRFVSYTKSDTIMITLDEEITIDNYSRLPHSLFEIRQIPSGNNSKFTSVAETQPTTQDVGNVSQIYNSLIENKIQCYPLNTAATIWSICYAIRNSNEVKCDLFSYLLKDEYILEENDALKDNEFFELGKDKIFDLCSEEFQNKHRESISNQGNGLTSKQILKKRQKSHGDLTDDVNGRIREQNTSAHHHDRAGGAGHIRYWNEFDDEESSLRNNTFYVDTFGDDVRSHHSEDNGFLRFDRKFVNSMFSTCQSIRKFLGLSYIDPRVSRARYGSIISEDDNSSVNTASHPNASNYSDIQQLIQFHEQDMDDSDSVYELRHDEMLSLMYLFALLASCLTSGICLSIILTIFREEEEHINIEHLTLLIIVIIVSLLLSLLLTGGSLLLLFSRYSYAPLWHYTSCFVVFLLVTCTVCYGIIEIFT